MLMIKKDIFVLVKGPTQGLGEHSLTAQKSIQSILMKIKKIIV